MTIHKLSLCPPNVFVLETAECLSSLDIGDLWRLHREVGCVGIACWHADNYVCKDGAGDDCQAGRTVPGASVSARSLFCQNTQKEPKAVSQGPTTRTQVKSTVYG